MTSPRLTLQTRAVLGALLEHEQPDAELYGLQIANASGLPPGTIYPILQRLRAAGWVEDRWEHPDHSQTHGRPPRRYYRLSTEGRARAVHALQRAGRDLSGLARLLAPQPGPAGVNPLPTDGRT
ncbi:MAG: PadR family transcriptional regulator [Pseudonocardiaceae bacterium]